VSPIGALIGNTGASGAGVQILNGAQSNTIGGSAPGAANLIAGNAQGGVEIFDTTAKTTVSGNSIRANGTIAIDLMGGTQTARVTANDTGDTDTGANNLQNYPVLTSAILGVGTTVSGTLNSAANATFRIEFFASVTADGTGFGEAENFIGAVNTTANASGTATFSAALVACVPAGQVISATATDADGNTSELSQNVTVTTTDTDADGLPNAYESANGLNPSVGDATLDGDGDGLSNLAEFHAGTNPNNPASTLRLAAPVITGSDIQLSLPTLAGRTYRIESTENLITPGPWRTFADQIAGTGSAFSFTDAGAALLPQRFYRAVTLP
jgi:hypothetical protein